jgi:hypothetical protein
MTLRDGRLCGGVCKASLRARISQPGRPRSDYLFRDRDHKVVISQHPGRIPALTIDLEMYKWCAT